MKENTEHSIEQMLKQIPNHTERKILRDVFYDVHKEVVEHNLSMYTKLKEKLYNEVHSNSNELTIYTSLEYIENINSVNGFLHPILPTDVTTEALKASQNTIIATAFLNCSFSQISRFLAADKTYKVSVITNNKTYEVKAKPKHCGKYINEIKKLYNIAL
jgi:uncharacterized protein YjaG (DUF416 family)